MNVQTLQAVMPCSLARATLYAPALTECMEIFHIDRPERQAAFLAQVAHETASLIYVAEIASGQAYEGRKDLGNTQAGDGMRYKGRGLLQTTGRANYRELHDKLVAAGYNDVPDFEASPDRLEVPRWAAASAGLYWDSRGLNTIADAPTLDNFRAISVRINGKNKDGLPNGWDDRQKCWARARGVLCGN